MWDVSEYPPTQIATVIEVPAGSLNIEIAGSAPSPGTANVFAWTTEASPGALLLSDAWRWGPEPEWIQSFGEHPSLIRGWVTICDGCEEECEGEDCETLPRLGGGCALHYTHESGTNATMTITYDGTECEISIRREPTVAR